MGAVAEIKRGAERIWSDVKGEPPTALAHFLRPNLGRTPPAARRVLEPIVAASALLALVVLIGMGTLSLAAFFVAAVLMYAIVTFVFGIELDIAGGSVRG
ncbi:MAG: hypothetical protein V3T05_04200 [Myxococcota bacterium]